MQDYYFGIHPILNRYLAEDLADALLIVAESDKRLFCVMVDELLGKQEVVIKSLGSMFEGVQGVAGGAILGDGRVGLILDLEGVFAQSAAPAT